MQAKPVGIIITILLLAGVIPGGTSTASASMNVIEKAHELKRDQIITLPSSGATRLSIRKCPACSPIVLGLDRDTRYFVDPSDTPLPLADWLAAEAAATDDGKWFYVFYRPADGVVTRIVLDAN